VKSNFSKSTNHLQSKFTIIRQKNYKSRSYEDLSRMQTSAEMPPKNGGVRKANSVPLHYSKLFGDCGGSLVPLLFFQRFSPYHHNLPS
jgi:hypothetical protein